MSETVIQIEDLSKEYVRDEFHVVALQHVDHQDRAGRIRGADGPVGLGQIDAAAPDRGDGQGHRAARSACWATTCAS